MSLCSAKKGLGGTKLSEFAVGVTNCTIVQGRGTKGASLLHVTGHISNNALHIRFQLATVSLHNLSRNFSFTLTPHVQVTSLFGKGIYCNTE